jgi:pilus assembly protein FimV
LRTALQKGAGRPIIHLKLLQIYAKRRDTEQFEAEARKLKGLVNGEGPEWDQALALGRSIDPRNALYGRGEAAEVAPEAGTAGVPVVDFDLDAIMGPGRMQAAEPEATRASAKPTLDFDLGGTTSEEPVAAEMDLSMISLDLDEAKSAGTSAGGRDKKWQDVAVKLDVASAYKEMGDDDGARELLNQALEEGDAAQQAQARQMLASLG